MEIKDYKQYFILIGVILVVAICLSLYASIPYIYTVCGFSAWAFMGHLVTLDDDMPGEWSNPDSSKRIWLFSKIELLIKFIILLSILSLIYLFPEIKKFGA